MCLACEACCIFNAIDIATVYGDTNMITVLAPLIGNPNEQIQCNNDSSPATPIHIAAINGREEALKALVTFTGNVNIVDTWGRTPMHAAADFGHINILKFLAPLMENPNVPDNKGKTPIDHAKLRGHDEFARILQSYIK